ncbi:MAG TPA: DEAD/DEAH box helicase [Vicinamibacterales bacterium]|jgi:ERCC4-related helicase
MRELTDMYAPPDELVLGTRINRRVPLVEQKRQRKEVVAILARLRNRPGVVLADEVGMGKTFVALGVAYSVAMRSPAGPVILMVPANLVDKWEQDLKTFCELYLDGRLAVSRDLASRQELLDGTSLRYGIARHSVELLKLLDDRPRERCHFIFVAQGAMGRQQTDKWVRLALIAEALRRHGRGRASRLIQVKEQIHRYLGELLWALGEERAHDGGETLWKRLLQTDPQAWKDIYNSAVREDRRLNDDPVPKAVTRAMARVDLKALAEALEQMPVRARGGKDRVTERLTATRVALRKVEEALWKPVLMEARWRSSLLVMDEAHHLKNPGTRLARQLQDPESEKDLRTGDGAMARAFDRMLFLTATPFQLGHHELVNVLVRFGDVRWDPRQLGERQQFAEQLEILRSRLDDSQRTAIGLQRAWSRLRPEDCDADVDAWWLRLCRSDRESLNHHQRAVVDAFVAAKRSRDAAEEALRPWIVRHNKGNHWAGTTIPRRARMNGGAVVGVAGSTGLPVPPQQMLPFFLAARSAVRPGQDLLGEALSSSYEAFRKTREDRKVVRDDQEVPPETVVDLSQAKWYLSEFDRALEECSGVAHPKVNATVRKVVDLWESGEKVLVFAFYRHTCRALRIHISREVERRINETARQRLAVVGRQPSDKEIERLLERVQGRFFDDSDSPGRKAIDRCLREILVAHNRGLRKARVSADQRGVLTEVMRRFLRVPTTLVRCFPLGELETLQPAEAVAAMLEYQDGSGVSWRAKFNYFIEFLTEQCSTNERDLYLGAAKHTQTGGIRVEDQDDEDPDGERGTVLLANVQVATGATKRDARSRLMRAFNTPFFPDILVCSQVMGEGVDLQRFCRHVIHHDLAWNPSTIEQRTGRIDRIGCKAEGRQPIVVYLPYLAGTADERQYQVMSEREQWFRVVMGQYEVAKLITPESANAVPLPEAISTELTFELGLSVQDAKTSRQVPAKSGG